MGFTNQERINSNTNALQSATLDSNPETQWYEKRFPFLVGLPSDKVYTQYSSIPVAANLSTAQTNATNNPTIIENLSALADAKRLTKIPGTNGFTFAAYSTYNDFSSEVLENWIQPQLIPQSIGLPSTGYAIVLYNGDPATTGTLITTSAGQTGSGSTASVGWFWNYPLGLLLLSQDFFTETGITSGTFDPYVMGFRYIGEKAQSASQTNEVRTQNIIANQAVAIGDIVYLLSSVGVYGRGAKALASSSFNNEVYVAMTAASGAGVTFTAALVGDVGITFASSPLASDNGKKVYLSSSVAGIATTTAPSGSGEVVISLGMLIGADGVKTAPRVLFRPILEMVIG